jgi:hypothetical protein
MTNSRERNHYPIHKTMAEDAGQVPAGEAGMYRNSAEAELAETPGEEESPSEPAAGESIVLTRVRSRSRVRLRCGAVAVLLTNTCASAQGRRHQKMSGERPSKRRSRRTSEANGDIHVGAPASLRLLPRQFCLLPYAPSNTIDHKSGPSGSSSQPSGRTARRPTGR